MTVSNLSTDFPEGAFDVKNYEQSLRREKPVGRYKSLDDLLMKNKDDQEEYYLLGCPENGFVIGIAAGRMQGKQVYTDEYEIKFIDKK